MAFIIRMFKFMVVTFAADFNPTLFLQSSDYLFAVHVFMIHNLAQK